MADISERLHQAAARAGAPPIDQIARRASRRRRARRVLAGAAVVGVLGLLGLAVSLGDDGSDESVEFVGDPPDDTMAAWTHLAGLVPTSAWAHPVSFDADGTLVLGTYFGGRNPEELQRDLILTFGLEVGDVDHGVVTMPPPEDVLITSGTFDLARIDAAVRSDPDWSELLTVKEWEGEPFYSWGDDYAIAGASTPLRSLGRGGRMLVRDDLLVFTWGDAEMHEIIERLVTDAPPPDQRFDEIARVAVDLSMTSMTYFGQDSDGPDAEVRGPNAPPTAIANDADGSELDTAGVREAVLLAFATEEVAEGALPILDGVLSTLVNPGVEVARHGPVVALTTTGLGFWVLPQGEGPSALGTIVDAVDD